MVRYLAYTGPKDVKRIEVNRTWVEFPRGQVVDIIEAGLTPERGKDLLRSGVFEFHEAPPLAENPLQCECGFIAKSKAGLSAHRRRCRA